jgi:heterodisulfide reductase subunit A
MTQRTVAIVGSGVAGLSAALKLAAYDIRVDVIEKSDFAGGHAIQFACKATDQCVKCGACMVEEKLAQAVQDPRIRILTGSRIKKISKAAHFTIDLNQKAEYINAGNCTACGVCLEQCPQDGAIIRGVSKSQAPFYGLDEAKCRYLADKSCTRCQDACPEKAITLDASAAATSVKADAVILATGFSLFDPKSKPYGYGIFPNVVTNMELESIVRRQGQAQKASDGKPAQSVAFIQCVGSRDAKLNHLWCSRTCCGAALRMAKLIKTRRPETDICFFYIDVQNFGRDFQPFYDQVQKDVHMIRAIPGDIFQTEDGRLKMTFVDNETHQTVQEIFDLVVLSVGLQPRAENMEIITQLKLKIDNDGFLIPSNVDGSTGIDGVFVAGTAAGPMSIAESIASAGEAAFQAITYFEMAITPPRKKAKVA